MIENLSIEEVKEFADPEALSWDGFEDAILGVDTNGRLVYDIDKMAQICVERDKMDIDEAMEYLEFNYFCAYIGELTPLHIRILRRV